MSAIMTVVAVLRFIPLPPLDFYKPHGIPQAPPSTYRKPLLLGQKTIVLPTNETLENNFLFHIYSTYLLKVN